ncbi:hypothetical protein DFH28DRAFT_1133584 [Melampsora americana]|nr:hypothetical protein DFH28DRAFT_1133584 [Melampsora americana]
MCTADAVNLAVDAAAPAPRRLRDASRMQHVLKRPDTNIGSVEGIRQYMWVYDKDKKAMVNKEISFVSVPIEIHETKGCYIPELIFGHLLAGSNFDDDEKKTTGGRNGYGAQNRQKSPSFESNRNNSVTYRAWLSCTVANGVGNRWDPGTDTLSPDRARFSVGSCHQNPGIAPGTTEGRGSLPPGVAIKDQGEFCR